MKITDKNCKKIIEEKLSVFLHKKVKARVENTRSLRKYDIIMDTVNAIYSVFDHTIIIEYSECGEHRDIAIGCKQCASFMYEDLDENKIILQDEDACISLSIIQEVGIHVLPQHLKEKLEGPKKSFLADTTIAKYVTNLIAENDLSALHIARYESRVDSALTEVSKRISDIGDITDKHTAIQDILSEFNEHNDKLKQEILVQGIRIEIRGRIINDLNSILRCSKIIRRR